jgi:HEAT repeat protein
MTFFCPNCWRDVPETAVVCPHCGHNIAAQLARADYADKLIAALHHPEPTTPVRAAWILGERRERKAVGELCRLVLQSGDAFIIESAIEALGKIGDRQALRTVRVAANHPSPLVRAKARRALSQLSPKEEMEKGAHK